MLLLRPKDKDKLIEIFESIQTPIEVWAYGSRVNGTAHSGSDLDLVVRTNNLEPLSSIEYQTLLDKIQNSSIPILVELRDWALVPERFHNNIEEKHEVIYSSLIPVLNEGTQNYKRK